LQATELIFASWESARRRGRVDLPLEIEDNPLEDMVEAGQLGPEKREADPDSPATAADGGDSPPGTK
jgi:hypothetical protein